MRRIASIAVQLDDQKAELARRNHEQRIQLAESRLEIVYLGEFSLADGVQRLIPHGLGRAPKMVLWSIRGAVAAGYINEIRTGSHDRSKFVVLQADDYGATITVDVSVIA